MKNYTDPAFTVDEEDLINARGEQDRAMLAEQEQIRKDRFASLSGIKDHVNMGVSGTGGQFEDTSGVPWHQRLRQQGAT